MPASFSIPVTGLAANDPVPGNYLEINFAQGPASIGQNTYAILLMGNRSTAGAATVDTQIYGGPNSPLPLQTTQDAITLFGQGSELHRMFKRVVALNTGSPIFAIAVAESAGVAATGAITYVTPAAANGNVRVWVGDDFTDVSITNGDAIATIATNTATAINAKLDWAVTASPALGVVTLTAKQKGPRGNWLRFAAVITGTGVATTSSATAPAFLASGATADSNTNALATINPFRFYYIASAAEDASQLGALCTQVNTQGGPLVGLRQRVFAGSVDTSGNATTIATGINNARCDVMWLQNSEVTPSELAANLAAVVALEEANLSGARALNYDFYGNDAASSQRWQIKAPRSGTAPTRSTIKSALNNGLSPVAVNPNGTTYIVSLITTRSLNGATNDYRIRDHHKVTICDRYGDDLLTKFGQQFAGKRIADDPVPGQRLPGSTVVTPSVVRAAINKLTTDYDNIDLLQNVATIIANTQCIREASPTTRMSARIPLQPIDALHQIGIELDQVG